MGVVLTELVPRCVTVQAALYKRKRHGVYASRGPRAVPRSLVGKNTPEGLSNGNRAGEKRLDGRAGRDHRLDEKETAWVDCSPSGLPPGVRLVQGGAGAGRVVEAGA
jgi:hypothetical protein